MNKIQFGSFCIVHVFFAVLASAGSGCEQTTKEIQLPLNRSHQSIGVEWSVRPTVDEEQSPRVLRPPHHLGDEAVPFAEGLMFLPQNVL